MRKLFMLITIVIFFSNFANSREMIKCQYPTDPEPELIPKITFCNEVSDSEFAAKWACNNGFTIVNDCRGSTFEKNGKLNNISYIFKIRIGSGDEEIALDTNKTFYQYFTTKSGYDMSIAYGIKLVNTTIDTPVEKQDYQSLIEQVTELALQLKEIMISNY